MEFDSVKEKVFKIILPNNIKIVYEYKKADDNYICLIFIDTFIRFFNFLRNNERRLIKKLISNNFIELRNLLINYLSETKFCEICNNEIEYKNKNLCEECLISKNIYKKISNKKICVICQDDLFKRAEILTKCNHLFHKKCLVNILDERCPICRENLYYNFEEEL